MVGYSARSLVAKLGIKEGYRCALVNAPPSYRAGLGKLPRRAMIAAAEFGGPLDFIHVFSQEKQDLENKIPELKQSLSSNGVLWVSWPKIKSKVETDLNENIVREIGLKNGLVDVKVCAVDETWSGLKFVYRLKDRPVSRVVHP